MVVCFEIVSKKHLVFHVGHSVATPISLDVLDLGARTKNLVGLKD